MAIESEVLVIGGGIAGVTSALAAARAGADVRLLSYKQSSLRQASGLIDLLGYVDGEIVVDPYEAMADLHADHPYRLVGTGTVREAMALFDETIEGYRGDHTETNALLPTHGGTVKPTARYPAGAAEGVASDGRDTLLVGFETLVDFDAPLAASHLAAAGAPFAADGATITFPGDLQADAKVTRYAKLLDQDSPVAVEGNKVGARTALAERVKPHLEGHERVGFPAVLGDDHTEAVRAALADELGAAVFEVPMGPPSLPGLRLEDRLFDALDRSGANYEAGNPVVGYEGGGRIDHVVVDRNGADVPYSADQYVLATGGLVSKGVESDREAVREPIFDCHVPHPEDRYDWFEDGVFDDHAFAQFGVDAGPNLRPRDRTGEPEFANLRAAGATLGGYDFAAEKSGSGVSIATGYAAGRAATEDLT
jgi:glycerol-3-phosphate dehydrogenase subunit B